MFMTGSHSREAPRLLTEQQAAEFHENGFLVYPKITSLQEIVRLRRIFERLFLIRAGRREGNQYDLVGLDGDDDTPTLPSIINPVNYAPELKALQYRKNAITIAKQLLGPSITASFEQVILKPARYGSLTPWHQDEAYRVDPKFAYNQVSIWLPIGEATIANGCMHYVPASNRGPVLPHRSFKDDPRIQAVECVAGFDDLTAQPCPLNAGDAVMHHGRTLHYAGPNSTDTPRYAYILSFEVPPRPLGQTRDFAWLRVRRPLNSERRRAWRKKGGIVIEAVRKFRLGMLNSPGRVLFEVRRGLSAFLAFLSREK